MANKQLPSWPGVRVSGLWMACWESGVGTVGRALLKLSGWSCVSDVVGAMYGREFERGADSLFDCCTWSMCASLLMPFGRVF